jgi:hypothetical protein
MVEVFLMVTRHWLAGYAGGERAGFFGSYRFIVVNRDVPEFELSPKDTV